MLFAPRKNETTKTKPWEGYHETKPWDFEITAVIPTLNTPKPLELLVKLLQIQSIKPFIIIVDTGSDKTLEYLREENVEIHYLKLHGVKHPSDFTAIAMDLAFSLCRTEYMFATHSDCFPRRKNLLEDLLRMTKTISPVVGYEISPRAHKDWKGMVSHTATMYHIPTMDKIGLGWNLRRLCNIYGTNHFPNPKTPTFPDSELLQNYIFRSYNIKPHIIGSETNFDRHIDENIDHCRSYTGGYLYNQNYFRNFADKWMQDAIENFRKIFSLPSDK
jgi:glycosyltransferase involved in cell wall biosynthesis